MPGPVSDSYDPEFGTAENASVVCEAIVEIRGRITAGIGSETLLNIVELARAIDGPPTAVALSERQLRIIRFCMNRALESL